MHTESCKTLTPDRSHRRMEPPADGAAPRSARGGLTLERPYSPKPETQTDGDVPRSAWGGLTL